MSGTRSKKPAAPNGRNGMSRFLLIDTNFLCHRAFHTTGGLSHKKIRTGVVFGVVREIEWLLGWYKPAAVAWCFDSMRLKRKELYSGYKERRVPRTEDEQVARSALSEEINELRRDYLPALGFRNVFVQKGYEADDVIAALAANVHFSDQAVIVGCDHDLYQCLTPQVRMFNPIKRKEYTVDDFRRQWGVHPSSWARVKAIAGCSSDDIKGVEGVGDKTAAKFVAGQLPHTTKAYQAIERQLARVNRNIELTRLPFPGTEAPAFSLEQVTNAKWRKLAKRLGMKRLIDDIELPRLKQRGETLIEDKQGTFWNDGDDSTPD